MIIFKRINVCIIHLLILFDKNKDIIGIVRI